MIPLLESLADVDLRPLFGREILRRQSGGAAHSRSRVAADSVPPPGVHARGTVSAAAGRALLAAMGPFRGRGESILRDSGIADLDGDGWMPLQAFLRALRTVGETVGPNTVFQVGRHLAHHVPLPAGPCSLEKVLALLSVTFDMMHAGGASGAITFHVESPGTATITTGTPYPCDFDRGVIAGFFQHLLGVRVTIDAVAEEPCKARRGETCTYLVTLPAA